MPDCRHRIDLRRDEPARWQPPEVDRKQHDQEETEPEVRHRDTGERRQPTEVIDDAALVHRRYHTGRQGDQERDQEACTREHQGGRKSREQEIRDITFKEIGAAEITLHHSHDPVQVLDRRRFVETELVPHLLDNFRVVLEAEHDDHGIAGKEAQNGEECDAAAKQDQYQRQQSLQQEESKVHPDYAQSSGWGRAPRRPPSLEGGNPGNAVLPT